MLLHLPIAILAAFSPVAVSDAVPKFDIVRECRLEGGSTVEFDRCSQDEAAALEQLKANWAQFTGVEEHLSLGGDGRRFRELCRAFDLSGNGPRSQQHRQKSARSDKDRLKLLTSERDPARPGLT
jgi:hypothetical protein